MSLTNIVDISGKLMVDEFPMWARLHVYWRTLPHFNHLYCPTLTAASKPCSGRFKAKLPLLSRRHRLQMLTTGSMMRSRTLKVEATAAQPFPSNSRVQYLHYVTSFKAHIPVLLYQPEIIVIEDTPPPEEHTSGNNDLKMPVDESKPSLKLR